MYKKLMPVLVLAVTACGPGQVQTDETVEVSLFETEAEALTTPPVGIAFTLVGGAPLHMKTGQGRCAYWTSTVVWTTACSTASNQNFALYKMQDGYYDICRPDTLVSGAGTVTNGSTTYPSTIWTATCLVPKKDAQAIPYEFAIQSKVLSFKSKDGTYWSGNGAFSWRAPYIVVNGFGGRRVTDALGALRPDVATGNSNQQWSFY